ncbi:hypothetical protein IAS59_006048 [Cryptococcus gattii]
MATNPNTPAPPATRTNPISLRIYKAIGTSFDDVSSREALEIASGMYGPEDPKGKGKVQSEYEELEEDDDTLPKRRTLKGQSAATARKYLKQDIETSLATGSAKFLEAFAEVDQFLLERADVLRSQRASAQLRAHLITLFLSRFVLSNSELAALTSREVTIGQPLFDTLDHLEKIRTDCEVLLGGEEGKTQAGLDIMSVTSEQLESGYTKIHRYCQFEFRQFTRDTQLEVSPVMRQAIHRLRDRPALLADAIQTLTSTRQSSILQQFLDALTRGGPGGLPRPIEIHAHDPTRYVGDMLAWVHQTTATEHEFLEGMFGVKEKGRWVGQAREGEEGEEERMASEVLDKNLEGLSRPLKLRIQQTIKSQEGIIMAIHDQAYIVFYETLDAQGRSLLRFLHPPDATLTPPITLRDAAHILRELLSVYSTSLIDPAERESDEDLAKLLDKAIGPCVEMCERMAEMRRGKSGGGEWERDIFMVNSLGYLEHTLEMFDFTTRMLHMLDEKIKIHVESMTFEHHGKLLEACGLAAVMRTIRTRPADSPLSRLDATSPKSLTSALSKFSTWLSTVDPSTSPRLALLTSSRLAEEIHRKVLRKIYEAYGEVCERVLDKAEGYEFGETMLRRGREEVGVALGVGEDWESEEDMEQRSTKKKEEQEGSAEDQGDKEEKGIVQEEQM